MPEQRLMLRRAAKHEQSHADLEIHLGLPNYIRNLCDFGFDDDDVTSTPTRCRPPSAVLARGHSG